ncbi:purF, partial [Symbiodinium necroappetens]
MMEAVTTGNKAAQAAIFQKQAAVAACQAPNATDMAVFKAGLRVSAGDVVSCR